MTSILGGRRTATAAVLVVLAWFCTSVWLASQGAYQTEPPHPPLNMLLAIVMPPLLFSLAIASLPGFKRWVLAIDPVFLTAVQGLRIFGGAFLFLYAFGHLPALFAMPAGWGDVLVAVLAPFVVALLAANRDFLKSKRLLAFHLLGLFDFVGAIGSGLLARGMFGFPIAEPTTSVLGSLPLSVIPGFAVPLWICLHIAALLQIKQARSGS